MKHSSGVLKKIASLFSIKISDIDLVLKEQSKVPIAGISTDLAVIVSKFCYEKRHNAILEL